MGAGCSSPLRRLGGGKRAAANRDSSISDGPGGDGDEPYERQRPLTIAAKLQAVKQQSKQAQSSSQHLKSTAADESKGLNFQVENEVTCHSETNEDQPSSASYYADGRNEQTTDTTSKSAFDHLQQAGKQNPPTLNGATPATARIVGFGSSVSYDRHLLVSPALSPAPSICCQSPAPTSSYVGNPISLDLNDLEEAFITLTFGAKDNQIKHDIKPKAASERLLKSEFCNFYNQQLVQVREDLIGNVTVVFIATDNAYVEFEEHPSSKLQATPTLSTLTNSANLNTDSIANKVETCLRSICSDYSFNLRFLNLSHDHLSKSLHVNNIQEAAMRIFEEEFRENSHRNVVIILSNGIVNVSNGSSGETSSQSDQQPVTNSNTATVLSNTTNNNNNNNNNSSNSNSSNNNKPMFSDKRLLPTKIDAQVMIKLLELDQSILGQNVKDLLKLWYNQTANVYHLKPIYLVNKKILSKVREERALAWQAWLADSEIMLKALVSITSDDDCERPYFASKHLFKSLLNFYLEFIINEPLIQKRTLLIRSYSAISSYQGNNQQQHQQQQQQQMSPMIAAKVGLNDLARLLADPCKLTMKRTQSNEEFSNTIVDWINENFIKHLENFLEAQISSGKYTPPFIERNLFIELTRQRHYLDHHLDNTSVNFLSKCQNFYTSQFKSIFRSFFEETTTSLEPDYSASGNSTESKLSVNSQPAANHLIFVSGPKGCGKSTLFAHLIRQAANELMYKVQIIYRFCGLTVDSLNSNRLLRSICEQFCQGQGENTTAASYIYSSRRREIMDALNKIIKSRNVLILLDGIETLNDEANETCLDWLCELEANPRIKIVMTLETNSSLYKKVLNTYSDATHMTMDCPTTSEWAQMLASTARNSRFNSSGSLYDELKKLEPMQCDKAAPSATNNQTVTYRDTFDVLNLHRIMVLNNEHRYSELTTKMAEISSVENLINIHRFILKHLEYLLSPYLLCSLFVALDSSRNGLSEMEIIEIMDLISGKQQFSEGGSKQQIADQPESKFSGSLLGYLRIHLKPWLQVMICDRAIKLTVQRDFSSKLIAHYVPSVFPKIITEVRDVLLDYYSKPIEQLKKESRAGSGPQALAAGNSPTVQIKDKTSRAESSLLGTQASETMNLLIQTNPSKAKSSLLSKQCFYNQFINRFIPEEFIEDYERLKAITGRKLSQNEELQQLVNFTRQSIFPLRYDGRQIYSQIYCRSYETSKSSKSLKSKKYNEIVAAATCPPIWSLLPISETSIDSFTKTRIGHRQPVQATTSGGNNNQTSRAISAISDSQRATSVLPSNQLRQPNGPQLNAYQQSSKQKIFTIRENHRHVIAIYPERNKLAVWDIYEERTVRVIDDIDHPRDLRMIDQKRAVILCNRELRVYDLDSGALLTKLKGVMNQKMPFFEIFGQDYVIALARNRMYVNMLNINTGELETTFKVGEDRFLNSLLVSAEGGICVCGDETQKPFPLLVWNLNERRLMYDLRLERHEFITRLSAISDDGHFVVSVCKQLGDKNESSSIGPNASGVSQMSGAHKSSPNFIVIYDLNSGTLFKKWKPGLDTCGVAISLFANRTGKLINSIVDSSILVWDLTTGSKRHTLVGHSAPADVIRVQNNRLFSMDSTCRDQSLRIWDIDEGYCLATFSPDAPVSCSQMSIRGDVLVCGFASETRLSSLVMCKNETVGDVVKRNKRRKSSKSLYIFDEPPERKPSS